MTTITAPTGFGLLAGTSSSPPPHAPGRSLLAARFLGGFSVAIDHIPVPLGTSRRTRALLAFLIDRAARPVPRDVLMDAFWPDSPPEAARNSLHVAMCGVRKALARVSTGSVIEFHGARYRVSDQIEVWSDAVELEQRCDQAAQTASDGRLEEATDVYEAALALYAGDFLADDPYLEWALGRREDLRLRALTCAERLSELHLERGDLHRALLVSTRVLREEPCHEPVARRLMVAYARLGQPHMAMRQFEKIVDVLRREIGVEPAAETVTLADDIRRRLSV